MALSNPRLSQRKLLQVGLESVAKGTAAVTFYDLQVWDIEMKPTSSMVFRRGTGLSTGVTSQAYNDGTQTGTCSFTCDMKTSGSNNFVAALAAAFQGCGMDLNTATYTPVSSHDTQSTVTIRCYMDGNLMQMNGCSGNLTIAPDSSILTVKFEFSGVWIAPTAASLPATCTWSAVSPHTWGNTTLQLSTTSAIKMNTFEFSTGNTIAPRWAQGTPEYYFVSFREPTLKIDPESDTVAGFDYYGKRLAGTQMSVTLASTGSDVVTLTIPKFQITDITPGDRDGIAIEDVTGVCVTSTNGGGDDEYSIVVT